MRVTVNKDLCQGHARCWAICPQVFSLDDEGHAIVSDADVPAEFEGAAQEAVNTCPERAITLA